MEIIISYNPTYCWILYNFLTYYNMNVFLFENDDRQDKNLIDQYAYHMFMLIKLFIPALMKFNRMTESCRQSSRWWKVKSVMLYKHAVAKTSGCLIIEETINENSNKLHVRLRLFIYWLEEQTV